MHSQPASVLATSPKVRAAVVDTIFPAWGCGLRPIMEDWLWLKLTTRGGLCLPFGLPNRKPYERLVVGFIPGQEKPQTPFPRVAFASTPFEHSVKPRLGGLFQELGLIPPESPKLELFARELQAGWVSLGNEALKFQDADFFEAKKTA